jgi:hypothetical protein
VRYATAGREVDVALTVDEHGMVVDYPGLAVAGPWPGDA